MSRARSQWRAAIPKWRVNFVGGMRRLSPGDYLAVIVFRHHSNHLHFTPIHARVTTKQRLGQNPACARNGEPTVLDIVLSSGAKPDGALRSARIREAKPQVGTVPHLLYLVDRIVTLEDRRRKSAAKRFQVYQL